MRSSGPWRRRCSAGDPPKCPGVGGRGGWVGRTRDEPVTEAGVLDQGGRGWNGEGTTAGTRDGVLCSIADAPSCFSNRSGGWGRLQCCHLQHKQGRVQHV